MRGHNTTVSMWLMKAQRAVGHWVTRPSLGAHSHLRRLEMVASTKYCTCINVTGRYVAASTDRYVGVV